MNWTKICLYLLAPLFMFLPFAGNSQVAYWQRYLGGKEYDKGEKLILQQDGTMVLAGESYSQEKLGLNNHSDDCDIVVLKYSTQQTIFWKAILGGSGTELLGKIIETSDGGFILTGSTDSRDGDVNRNRGGSDIWIVKLNYRGNIEWSRTMGGKNDDQGIAILETSDGDYIVGGESGSPNTAYSRPHNGALDSWLTRLDGNGTILWEKHYGGTGNEKVTGILEVSPGRFMIINSTDSRDGDIGQFFGGKDAWLFTIDGDGEMMWQASYGGSLADDIHVSLLDRDGNIVLGGTTFSADGHIFQQQGLGDCWILKIDMTGKVLWSRTFGGKRPEGINDISLTEDGGYIMCGLTKSRTGEGDIELNQGYYDGWVIKLKGDGNRQWSRTIGYDGKDILSSICEIPDGGYLILGYATQHPQGIPLPGHYGGSDFWLCNMSDPERDGVRPFVTPPVLIGKIRDRQTGMPLKANITLTNNQTLDSLSSTVSDATDGSFVLLMPAYGLVSINVLSKGYMFYGQDFLMDTIIDKTHIEQDIFLDPIKIGAKLILKNIYFNTGKWGLLSASNAELERVVAFMKQNPRVKVLISGHTDNTGNKDQIIQLSLNRANSVREYLLKRGIPEYSMRVKGYGMYRPIADNRTPEGRKKNRRVEFEITSK